MNGEVQNNPNYYYGVNLNSINNNYNNNLLNGNGTNNYIEIHEDKIYS